MLDVLDISFHPSSSCIILQSICSSLALTLIVLYNGFVDALCCNKDVILLSRVRILTEANEFGCLSQNPISPEEVKLYSVTSI